MEEIQLKYGMTIKFQINKNIVQNIGNDKLENKIDNFKIFLPSRVKLFHKI